MFTAVLPLPQVKFGEEIQGEDDFQAQRRERGLVPIGGWEGQFASVNVYTGLQIIFPVNSGTQNFPIILIPICLHGKDRKE